MYSEQQIEQFIEFIKSKPGNHFYQQFLKHGFHLLRQHYYLPIPEEHELSNPGWQRCSDLPGLNMNEAGALRLLYEVFPPYMNEFMSAFPLHQTGNSLQFYLINGTYMAGDAHVYYALLRHFKPKHIVEIGAGSSTLLALTALMMNEQETGSQTAIVTIDPYPSKPFDEPTFRAAFSRVGTLVEKRVQDIELSFFNSLNAGDILFIDSTHVLRPGGDVQMEYLEILPRLNPGVLIHLHDISLPKAYPKSYFDLQWFWNEQYLLQAFLAFNSRFEVLWPGNYMMVKHPEKLRIMFPGYDAMLEKYPQAEPSAFWLKS